MLRSEALTEFLRRSSFLSPAGCIDSVIRSIRWTTTDNGNAGPSFVSEAGETPYRLLNVCILDKRPYLASHLHAKLFRVNCFTVAGQVLCQM